MRIRKISTGMLLCALTLFTGACEKRSDPPSGASTAALAASAWNPQFRQVEITSSLDGSPQNAYLRKAIGPGKRPLVVSLHTWSSDYTQDDSLQEAVLGEDWNYIHPDFRGPNRNHDACLSELALGDIDDAIAHALASTEVDEDHIYVVGFSGGGYATLGSYLRTRHRVRAFLAWAPISDLAAWYRQSLLIEPKYAGEIVACTSQQGIVDFAAMRKRSPLYFDIPARRGRLEIYAGINDGHESVVPISHAIDFYNRIVAFGGDSAGLIGPSEAMRLLSRDVEPTGETIGDREVYIARSAGEVSIMVFRGGHETLPDHTVQRIKALIGNRGQSAVSVP